MIEPTPKSTPCDGTIPDGWQMPEIKDRISTLKNGYRIDFRGLKPPTPLVGTLTALSKLEDGFFLEGIYPQSPFHLFPALREAGWMWDILSQDNSKTHLKIYRESTAP